MYVIQEIGKGNSFGSFYSYYLVVPLQVGEYLSDSCQMSGQILRLIIVCCSKYSTHIFSILGLPGG